MLGPAIQAIQESDELVSCVSELSYMQEVHLGVHRGAAGGGGPAKGHGPPTCMRPAHDVLDKGPLHVHARDEHRICPAEVVGRGRPGVFVHETHMPGLG